MAEHSDPDNFTQHSVWNQGDFTLISSDNVVFKAPSRILLCVSDVLSDAAETSTGDKCVHFADPDIETSEVIERFLEFACQSDLKPEAKGNLDYCTDIGRFIAFLHKYECPRLLSYLELAVLKLLARGVITVMDAFAIGSAADAPFLCVSALERGVYELKNDLHPPLIFGKMRPGRLLGSLSDGCPLDPATMSLAAGRITQSQHFWALNRVWSLCHDIPQTNEPQTDDEGYQCRPEATRLLQTIPEAFSLLLGTMISASRSAGSSSTT